jgi:hypothetical protein
MTASVIRAGNSKVTLVTRSKERLDRAALFLFPMFSGPNPEIPVPIGAITGNEIADYERPGALLRAFSMRGV